jgi:hypothetical protein
LTEEEIIESIKKRYSFLPSFVIFRSLERARSSGDLFDILDTFPSVYPVIWEEDKRRWVTVELILGNKVS